MEPIKQEEKSEEERLEDTMKKVEGYFLLIIPIFIGWLFLGIIDSRFELESHKLANLYISAMFVFFCQSLAKLVRHELNRSKAQ